MKLSLQVCNELFPGKSVGKISHLGSGRMGNVYKIELNNRETLCVKILARDHASKFKDSNGWKLAYGDLGFNFKSYESNQYFYFTIPYFEGQLFHYASQYNLKSRLQIIQNLIKATADIHSKGLIHRDLKCSNIIINKEAGNKVNIIDFGRSVNFSDSSNDDLQLPGQGTLGSNIRRIFQPYTAPEYFKKNSSAIGFFSDYYSIAQLYRFLIPEYSYLADKVIHTEGMNRDEAFTEFSRQVDDFLADNQFSRKFNEPDKIFSDTYILYRKIIFFICQVLERLINLFRSSDPASKNNHKNITLGFFKSKGNHVHSTNLLPGNFSFCS